MVKNIIYEQNGRELNWVVDVKWINEKQYQCEKIKYAIDNDGFQDVYDGNEYFDEKQKVHE